MILQNYLCVTGELWKALKICGNSFLGTLSLRLKQLNRVARVKYLFNFAKHSLSLCLKDFERFGGVFGHLLQLFVL
jgi:hypothetical protein